MQLISVNAGNERSIEGGKASGSTGIYKLPQIGPVQITWDGIAGDTICDTKHHGGVDQAVYVYGSVDYAWWSHVLGRSLEPGIFGENLTISDLESSSFSAGDNLKVGSVTLQVTAPRGPCVTLAARMGDPGFVRRFRAAGRPGLYCRVLAEGTVRAGDAVTVERFAGETVTIAEMFRDAYDPNLSEVAIRRQLAAPIALRDRLDMEERLRTLLASG